MGREFQAPKPETSILPDPRKDRLMFLAPSRLPATSAERKKCPIGTGVLDYFPDALAAVAEASYAATKQHHPDAVMHWDRNKSTDEADCMIRHYLDRGTWDTDGVRHSAKVAWRALALLQKEIEEEKGLPISRGSIKEPK